MWFNSIDFLCFMAVVLPVFYALGALRRRAAMPRVVFLVAASCFFYMYWHPAYIILIVLSTVLDYCCGLLFLRVPRERQRWIIAISATGNLLILGFFKYGRFLWANLTAAASAAGMDLPGWPEGWDFRLPVGISFYTFQTMSYTIDIYRGKADVETNFFRFALFVTFFAQLVAGPIEKARDLLVQFQDLSESRPIDVSGAVQQITYGLFKKVAVADTLAVLADRVFAAPGEHSGPMVATAAVFFAFQIYCDFSGYTDIAIGVAKLFGVRLSMNFFFPYLCTDIRTFWRRWHISLSSWLREYLYISLGGNRRGAARTYANLMTTMLLGGLWHGASWNFVLWGALHGAYLMIHRFITGFRQIEPTPWEHRSLRGKLLSLPLVFGLGAFNFALVTLTWIPFRCQKFGQTWDAVRQIFTWARVPATTVGFDPALLNAGWLLIGILLVFDVFYKLEFHLWHGRTWASTLKSVFPAAFLVLTIVFGAEQAQQFIYFQF